MDRRYAACLRGRSAQYPAARAALKVLHGFPKSDKGNITQDEKKALQFAGKVFLELSAVALSKALQSGVLMEVHCEQDH